MSQKIDYQYIRPELRPKTMNRNQIFKGQVKEVRCSGQKINKKHSDIQDY